MKTLYLIDGYSFLYRAYHVMPPLTNPAGTPIGAVYGFTKMLLKLLQAHKPAYGVVAYDNAEPTLRKQICPTYKGNRTRREDMIPQFGLARDASRSLGFMNIEASGYEADDVIATLAERAQAKNMDVIIVSSDKDLMQLINDRVKMFDPMQECMIGAAEVQAKFGVPPWKLRDTLALTGDIADNVPGVPGIGIKKAARLINEYGNLATLLRQTGNIYPEKLRYALERNGDKALLAQQLISLYYDVPIFLEIEDMKILYHREQARDFCHLHDFKSLVEKL